MLTPGPDNWCADGVWNLGEENDIVGRDTILEHWQEAMQLFDFVGMFAQPKFIRVGDQDARAEWHTNELCRKSDGQHVAHVWSLSGCLSP